MELPPSDFVEQARRQNKDTVSIIRNLRSAFGLSLQDAKELVVRYDTGLSLADYQGSLLPDLEKAFSELELPATDFRSTKSPDRP